MEVWQEAGDFRVRQIMDEWILFSVFQAIIGGVLGFWVGILIMGAIFFAIFSVKKIMERKISAHADGGPRSRVRARGTLRSAPHQREQKFSGACVCRIAFPNPS